MMGGGVITQGYCNDGGVITQGYCKHRGIVMMGGYNTGVL